MRRFYTFSTAFKTSLFAMSLLLLVNQADAQVKIGANGSIIAPASLLELESTNQGLLLPRLADTAAINALNPPNGMLIYLTKVPAVGLYVRKVTGWEYLTGSLGGNGNFNSLTVSGSVTAGSFSGPLTGNATTATLATNATNSVNSAVINDLATTAVTFPTFVTQTPGNQQIRTSNANLSFVPNTGILTAKGFAGPLVGNVTGLATNATDAVNAANTGITNDVTTNALQYPTFVSGTTGNLPQKTSNTNLTFNPATGVLAAIGFSGNLVGNATSSTNATTTVITDDLTTAAVTYPTFVQNTSGNWGQRTSSTKLTYVPSTGVLTSPSFVSTIPTGTPPLVVASSSVVANLSATNAVNTAIVDDVATTTATYPTFVGATSGNQPQKTSSSRLTFIPSSGALTAGSYVSTVVTGTAPFVVTSTTPVTNLSIGGNAGTANLLLTPRLINGVSFNGGSNITVTADASTLTNNILATNVVTSSLIQVGTIGVGIWNAGNVSTPQLRGKISTTPTNAPGPGAGTGATVVVTGSDLAGQVSVTTGTAPAAGVVVTITFANGSFPAGVYPVLYPANAFAATAAQVNQVYSAGNVGGTSFIISVVNALTAATNYTWNYHVIGN